MNDAKTIMELQEKLSNLRKEVKHRLVPEQLVRPLRSLLSKLGSSSKRELIGVINSLRVLDEHAMRTLAAIERLDGVLERDIRRLTAIEHNKNLKE